MTMDRVPHDELLYDEEEGIYEHDGVPFKGISFRLAPGGWLESEQEFREGLPWGMGRTWFAPERLASESSSVGGVWHGVRREWHENGRLALEEMCELGVTLSRKRWNEEGQLIEDYHLQVTDPDYETLLMFRKHNAKRGWTAGQIETPSPQREEE
jgi:antitoxin component YwqK of YwqJK toxin-antitoxin module